MNMNVKQAAERSGVSSRNIRYYEQAGLLSPARDPGNDYRVYTEADVHALKLIRMLRTLDMPIEEIHAVLDGSTPLPQAAARQRERLEARQAKLAAASAFCGQLAADGTEAGTLDVDACLARMDTPAPHGGWFTGWVEDYRKVSATEHKRSFTFTPDLAVSTPREFTTALLAWAEENGEDLVITHEGMTPRFTLDGIEYKAARYWTYSSRIPVLRIRCEVCDPDTLETDVAPKRAYLQRLLHNSGPLISGLLVLLLLALTDNGPLWPDNAALLVLAVAFVAAWSMRWWFLYHNDQDRK